MADAEASAPPQPYGPVTRTFIRPPEGVTDWKDSRLRWALQLPRLTRSGARAIERHVDARIPQQWAGDFADKRVLVMGTGPSLDRAPAELLAGFDTVLHINFALRRVQPGAAAYFFTTDLGPVREYIDLHGPDDFQRLGAERCLYAPVFFDHWHYLTEAGLGLFTMLCHHRAGWVAENVRAGPLRLPLVWRYYPVQPEWEHYHLPPPGRRLPVIRHTSALSAVVFAAMQGSREIGLIGCDFSAGRAAAGAGQSANSPTAFSGAAAELRRIAGALAGQGVSVTNHSWEV